MCKHISESISLKQIVKLNENQTFSNYFNIPKIPKGAVNVEIVQHGHRGDGNHMGKMGTFHIYRIEHKIEIEFALQLKMLMEKPANSGIHSLSQLKASTILVVLNINTPPIKL